MIAAATVVDIFSDQVKKTPGALALKFGDATLTYRQLDELSNQLAHYLVLNGVRQGTLVPICLSTPYDMVIGIWGILKAGAAYVPIDPEFPVERIRYMVGDTGASLVISDSASTQFTAAANDKNIILANNDWAIIRNEPASHPGVIVSEDSVAYVIYTSGSTGNPKGVLIEHRSIMDYIGGLFRQLPYAECRSFALGVSFAADSVITHLFGSVWAGGTLHVFSKEDYNNVDYVHNYFATHSMDCLKAVPSHWKSLSRNGVELMPRKVLMFGGEALYTAMVKDIIPQATRTCVVVNHYGPTETTVGQLMHRITEGHEYGYTIPIGKTFTDATVYILNENGFEVADGENGELHISGTCVARGYLNRPDLTAQRFVPNTFSADPKARMYRTGDLVRRLPDGDIEFLGRIDDQVKIRGYRIELGEIENMLQKAPGVKQCVVVAKEGANGDKRLVGYVVCPTGYDKKAIISFLGEKLPAFMVPQLLMPLDELPFFPNGKVDKKALPNPDASALLVNSYEAPGSKTEKLISDIWKDVLAVERAGADDNFFELGGTSLLALKTVALLKTLHGIQVPITRLYQYPKIKDLAASIDGKTVARKSHTATVKKGSADVAVVGMAARFPGADSIEALWELLKNGKETTTFFHDHELDASVPASLRENPAYVRARGIIKDIRSFDATFFGISPKHAELMDPQQRVFLEIAWEALERAGYAPGKYEGSIGVFAGVRFNTYLANNVLPNTDLVENVGQIQVITLNDKDYVSTRSAYALNLKGPAVNVQSACSTSLVAIAQAAESIRKGQCDMALAGGATINSPVNVGHLYNEGAMLSSDGHCRPFDADATGTVFSDGAGVVLLKNMDDAIRDGDIIYAVIKGVGLSNDGGGKGSFTAPSAEGQAAAISMAIADAGIDPAHISYVEAHGTATPLGDPIEIEGLNIAFGEQKQKQYCAIGSIKSNFGHLTTSAGVAGFIKACLALYHKTLPPSLHYTKPNPHIDFANSPFFVNASLTEWNTKGRLAGVSSFGVGGTNAHVILGDYDNAPAQSGASRPAQLLCWSAKSAQSLDAYGDKLSAYFTNHTDANIADIAYTLNTSREDFDHRRFAVVTGADGFIEQSANKATLQANSKHINGKAQNVVFMFPGQGDQYVNMCRSLYDTENVFRQAMDECAELLKMELNENILDIIYPRVSDDAATAKINNTAWSQPALFTIGYALGKLWMSWGIYPAAFVGHSIGEFVAAYFSGVFSLRDALRLIATRGRMMGSLPRGSMLSVRLDHEAIQPYLSSDLALAASNSPQLSVVAGAFEAIDKLSSTLNDKGILNRILATSHAFHSHMMEPVVPPFEEFVRSMPLNAPIIPIMSTVTGEWMRVEDATDPHYWARHLRSTVFFGKAVQQLMDSGYSMFLELGPGKSVSTLARQQAAGKPLTAISSVEKQEAEQPSQQLILKALGQLWINGITPDWKAFYKDEIRNKRHDIPTYAFNKQEYWVDPPARFTAMPMQVTMPHYATETTMDTHSNDVPMARKPQLIERVRHILEDASGIDMSGATPDMTFIEMGLDSLLLTQVALMLKKQFSLPITFRQLNEDLGTMDLLTDHLDANLPADAVAARPAAPTPQAYTPATNGVSGGSPLDMISHQLQQLAAQVSMLQHGQPMTQYHTAPPPPAKPSPSKNHDLTPEEEIEIKKPFGAAARIEKQSAALSESQQQYLAAFTKRYNEKTKGSKAYTQQHRPYMADPRVVSGFRPATKELVYSIVIKRSRGSRLWDIDGNEYIDALNGFGSNMLGYQPDLLKNALIEQIEKGYEIGPQHELAGDVCKLICEFTGFDRAGLCNTGSEAVLGAMRIARTVTGRSIIVAFAGSYHGITDEVIVRGSRKLKSYPASPGIMPEAVQNMLILDYGTDEALRIIQERGHEIAAVLVEPIQSRRCDFQPVEFLRKLREITKRSKTVLVFDEVISGFRFHPGGAQAIFGIKADLATYGKVVGGGLSIGVVAGERQYMDALDGGQWQYGDDSIPEVGVTYFAGTFVRHPLVLATAKASLEYFKQAGPALQEGLNAKGQYMGSAVNALCRKYKVPMFAAQFGSLWRIRFLEEYPYMELFFTLMRYKGIHIQEGFPCFMTEAHTDADMQKIITCFEESLVELKDAGLIPEYEHAPIDENKHLNTPPAPGARLGKDKEGNPAWFVKDEANPGKYLQVTQ